MAENEYLKLKEFTEQEEKEIAELKNEIRPTDLNRPYVFISYSKADSLFVYRLAVELQKKAGLNIWIDTELTKEAGTWNGAVQDKLDSSNCIGLMFMVSTHSLGSINCGYELLYAKFSKKELGRSDKKSYVYVRLKDDRATCFGKLGGNLEQYIEKQEELDADQEYQQALSAIDRSHLLNDKAKKDICDFILGFKKPPIREQYITSRQCEYTTEVMENILEAVGGENYKDITCKDDDKVDEIEITVTNKDNKMFKALCPDIKASFEKEDLEPETSVEPEYSWTYDGNNGSGTAADLVRMVYADQLQKNWDRIPIFFGCNLDLLAPVSFKKGESADPEHWDEKWAECEIIKKGPNSVSIGHISDIETALEEISKLFTILGIPSDILTIIDGYDIPDSSELLRPDPVRGDWFNQVWKRSTEQMPSEFPKGVTYRYKGKNYTGNQNDMLFRVVEDQVLNNPDRVEDFFNYNINCLAPQSYNEVKILRDNYDREQKKREVPLKPKRKYTHWSTGRDVELSGGTVCIGGGFSAKEKLKEIGKLFSLLDVDPSILECKWGPVPAISYGTGSRERVEWFEKSWKTGS